MARVNLIPDSESAPEPSSPGHGSHQLHDRRVKYDRDDRQKAERARQKKVLDDTETREAGSTGVTYRGRSTQFEDAVQRVQGMLRSGRTTYEQAKAEHDADARSLQGFKAAPPRPGTPAHARLKAIRDRFAILGRALELEQSMFPRLEAQTPATALSEIGWTDAARAASAAARRLGRKAKRMLKAPSPMTGKSRPYRTFDKQGRMVRVRGAEVNFRQHAKYGPVHVG